MPVSKGSSLKGKQTYNLGFDARNYVKIYRNFIWATRVAGDFSFGDAKLIYYLEAPMDGSARNSTYANQPAPTGNMPFNHSL
jgi:hypothetical protein